MTLSITVARKGRLGSRKSNDGCTTCKIRKVKCDELHPACRRCLTTGRKCDGYIRNTNLTKSALAHVITPTTYANLETAELQSFEFFMRRFVPGSTKLVDAQFWDQLVPQLSHSDPVIWDAVIALSRLMQHPQYSRRYTLPERTKPPVVDAEHRRALTWYGRSMTGLRHRMQQTTTPSATDIISCILYICIECLQDNISEAVALYQRAVAMMRTTANGEVAVWPTTQLEKSIGTGVRDLLQNMAASQRIPTLWERIPDQYGATFESPLDAREELFVLLFDSHDFIMDSIKAITINQDKDWSPPSELVMRQQSLQARFEKWYRALENSRAMLGTTRTQDEESEDEGYSLLLVTYGQYYITLSNILNMYEIAFDKFNALFQTMVDHASRIIIPQSKGPRPVFMFETRFIPQLFFVATKCRHPTIRRQAIKLLRLGPEVENTWKADTLADIAERVVGTEESGNINGTFRLEPCSVGLPPENHRMCWDRITELPGSDGQPANFHQFVIWQQTDNHTWLPIHHMVNV
ncbi:hypothetical protein LTR84_007961 [Exophiala bonariae]|uniref:Zn(2)-C6 fungal-type domain-containing protein n=1 Tax=Exophiala bonariae TaxID=1690606 RepID=A0AAV9NMG3_9EURO|nr:hypothetical protein LTR84_007961 [Exophiala bonariae]